MPFVTNYNPPSTFTASRFTRCCMHWWHPGSRSASAHPSSGSCLRIKQCFHRKTGTRGVRIVRFIPDFRYRSRGYFAHDFASAGLNHENLTKRKTKRSHAHGQRRLRPGSGHQKLLRSCVLLMLQHLRSKVLAVVASAAHSEDLYIHSLYVSARQRVEILGWLKYGRAASRSWLAVALSSFSFLRYCAYQSSRSARTYSPRNFPERLKLFAPLFSPSLHLLL